MNREPDPTLHRDLFATAAAVLRRRSQTRRQATLAITLLAFFASLVFFLVRPGPSPEPIAPVQPSPAPARSEAKPTPSFDTLNTDDELLAALADQGPMLITHPDGRKQLLLTRPR